MKSWAFSEKTVYAAQRLSCVKLSSVYILYVAWSLVLTRVKGSTKELRLGTMASSAELDARVQSIVTGAGGRPENIVAALPLLRSTLELVEPLMASLLASESTVECAAAPTAGPMVTAARSPPPRPRARPPDPLARRRPPPTRAPPPQARARVVLLGHLRERPANGAGRRRPRMQQHGRVRDGVEDGRHGVLCRCRG